MQQPYDTQDIDGDFTNTWENDTSIEEMSFGDYTSGLRMPDFLTTTDTDNVDAAIQQDGNLRLDPSLNWMIYLEQDYPLSAYPPLDNDDAANSLPYGHWAVQQFQQNPPLAAQNPHANNLDLTPNIQVQPNNIEIIEIDSDSETIGQVSPHRTAKQRGGPSCDPSLCCSYATKTGTHAPWGSMTWNGQHLFSYTPKGQLLRDRCYSKQQLQEYVDNCGKDTVFWVQQAPTQCNRRLDPEDRICRWANCPVGNRTITAGWLRVAFDEFPHRTSSGSRDPLKCAGSMHLWCFEQVFDPAEFHVSGRLRPEIRQFPNENKNVVSLEKLTDVGIVREAYQPWFAQRLGRFDLQNQLQLSREYRETLSYCLTKYHLDHQTAARQKARSKRNEIKRQDERKTIDVHLGNLKMFVDLTNKARQSRKIRKLQRSKARGEKTDSPDTDDSARSDIPSQPWAFTNAQLTRNGGQIAPASQYMNPSREAPSTHLLQSRQYSLGGGNLQEASAQRPRRDFGRQPTLPQPTAGSYCNLDTSIFDSTSPTNWNINSGLPHYFNPLNPAHNAIQSSLQPSLMARASPNNFLDRQASVSNSNYPHGTPDSRFNMVTQGRLGYPLRSLVTLFQQQQLGSLGDIPNSQLETPQGSGFIKREQDETKAFAQPTEETLPLLGDSGGTGLVDPRPANDPSQEELHFNHLIDSTLFEDELETNNYLTEADSEADNIFTAHTLTDADASQPLGPVACTVSPQDTAAAESWDSFGSFMDTEDFGGFFSADTPSLFDDFTPTNGVDGESRNF
ncbi:hypothetical protein ACHAQJ_001401 [Trichoderma viride]